MHLPFGLITLWSGAIADIPDDWVLCNGANGTPDLRDRFVLGAGGAQAPDDIGGDPAHSHTGTTDGHSHDVTGPPNQVTPGVGTSTTSSTNTDTFLTSVESNFPNWYSLAYIMHI